MKNFKEAYKETMDSIPVPGFRTEEISEENSKKRILPYRRKRYMAAAAFAGGIFVIYTLGGVAAAGYARSLVRVDENGFQTMDMDTALLQQEMQLSRITAEGDGEEVNVDGTAAACMEDSGMADLAKIEESADSMMSGRMAGAEEHVENTADAASEEEKLQSQNPLNDCALYEQKYTSFEEFAKEHDIPLALPAESLLEELKQEEYVLFGNDNLLVRLETKESVLLLHQSYYGDTLGHVSATAYTGGVSNERTYTTLQGFAYKLADSQDGEEIHAAIAVGYYELILDFYGYGEQEVYEVLEDMDLTVYL